MNKQLIIKEYNAFLKHFNLKPEEFIIGAGAACLMYGLRDSTDDIDAAIDTKLFDTLLHSKKYNLHYFGNAEVLEYNQYIDLHRLMRKFDTKIVDGVCCYSPKELLNQKLSLNRPKDQNDIKALKILVANEDKIEIKDTVLDILLSIKKKYSKLFTYKGFGYCGYLSAILKQALDAKHIDCKILLGSVLKDTKQADKAKITAINTILSITKDSDKQYLKIKDQFIKKGDRLPHTTGHAAILIGDTVYDITSGQFGLPNKYKLSDFKDTWKDIRFGTIKIGEPSINFGVTSIKRLDTTIGLETILTPLYSTW